MVTRECSWVDRLWSLCPPAYCLIVAAGADFDNARLNAMALLVIMWGSRLTFNFARKGGYQKGGEDYRWAVVRERAGPIGFQVLNITFISPGQMLLVWLTTAPMHQAWLWREAPLNWLDGVAAALFLALLALQTTADEQMWRFQQDKKRRVAAGEEISRPFMTTGLVGVCRHPNYFCEMAMWLVFYLFAVAVSAQWLHWTGLGFILLIALFIPSTRLGESISVSKYPAYRDYRTTTTPSLIPLLRLGRAKSTA